MEAMHIDFHDVVEERTAGLNLWVAIRPKKLEV